MFFDEKMQKAIEDIMDLIEKARKQASIAADKEGYEDHARSIFCDAYIAGFVEGYITTDFCVSFLALARHLEKFNLVSEKRMIDAVVDRLNGMSCG